MITSLKAMLLTLPALLIDASNLNLRFNPDAAECLTWKDDTETLLGDLGAFGAKSGRTVSAIFDGGAYHGEYAGEVFEAPDAGVRILFTPKGASADDAMIELASSMCADDAAAAAFSAGDACDYLETERGLVQLTLKKSPAGRAKRKAVEQTLASAGLRRLGQISTLLAYTDGQRTRSVGTARGLMRFGNEGAIEFKPIGFPGCALVTSDVHLRRRCGDIGAASLSENQLKTWLDAEAEADGLADDEDDAGGDEGAVVENKN